MDDLRHGSYDISCDNFINHKRCPYCSSKRPFAEDSIGAVSPEIISSWSKKNKLSPFEYTIFSNKRVFLQCELGLHDDYSIRVGDYTKRPCGCPRCFNMFHISKLQSKVKCYIESTYNYSVLTERDCNLLPVENETNRTLPFDNEVEELWLIVEVHGEQHYNKNSGWNSTYAKHNNCSIENAFERRQYLDKYKKKCAIENGYQYLEIPYYTENDESYKILIDNKIKELMTHTVRHPRDCNVN